MPFGFDPRKLVDDEKKLKKEEVVEAVNKQLTYDEELEKSEANIRKNSNIKNALDSVSQIVREFKYRKKYGDDAYYDEKLKQDPDFRDPRNYTEQENKQYYKDEIASMEGMLSGAKLDFETYDTVWDEGKGPTLESKYGDKPEKQSFTDQIVLAGSTGKMKVTSKGIPFESEVGITESIYSALASASIKIPKGFANLGAMVMDWADDRDLPVDKGRVAQLENWWEQTFIGQVEKYAEEKARETAVGKITETLVQLYGGWKSAGKYADQLTTTAFKMYNKAISGLRQGKYVKTAGNKEAYKLAQDVSKWNRLSGKQKFAGVFIGGAVTGGVVYDAENIGTFGDLFFDEGELTALDRDGRESAQEDATRMLYNKLKFAGEMGFPIIPAIVGGSKVAKSITSGVMKRAANASKFDKFVDKFVARPLRSRGPFPEEEFQAIQRLEGKKSSANLMATDYLRNFDEIIKRISKYSQSAADKSGMTNELSDLIVNTILKGKLGVSGNKVVVKGFEPKMIDDFYSALTKKLNVSKADALKLVEELSNVHGSWADFLNVVVKGKNLNVSAKEFVNIMKERIRDTLSNEYKIFKDNGLRPVSEYAPSNDVMKEVADIFVRSAKANRKKLNPDDAMLVVKDIIKNVQLDPNTATPIFKYEAADFAKEKALITKNIADNITGGGKFKPDKKGGLIQTKKDLDAFNNLFGNYKNANRIISNVTTDLAEIAARDRFYNVIKTASDDMIKRGEKGIVYPTYNAARKAFGLDEKLVDASRGLQLPQKLGEKAYTVPINGMYTTEAIAQGLKFGALNSLGSITKNAAYQYAVMIPKGLIQAGKTVGGPFTHSRNFSSGAVTTVSLGNISLALTNPLFVLKSMKSAFNTLQPQILYRNKPGARPMLEYKSIDDYSNALRGEAGQSLYRFLLDEGMVNASAIYRDVIGLIEDTAKTGFLQKMWRKLGNKTQKFLKGAQDMYIAEDDIWKIFNFFAEDFKINRAYQAALKAGTLTKNQLPNRLEIMKMATKNVREMLPNYAYVSELVQASRRSPLGNFVSWPAEIIRTSNNIMAGAKREIKDPILKRIGWERATGFATTVGIIGPAAVWGGMQAYGFTKDKLMALREFVPWFSEDSTLIPVYEDGKYKYIDFSRAFFYDTVTNPIQAMFTELNRDEDRPVIPAMTMGLVRAFARLVEPFVSESIWIGGVLDIYARKGQTKQGSRIWNERDSDGDKIFKTFKHLAKLYTPGSQVQMQRLYSAITGKTIKGTEYEVTDELLGLIGLRKAPLDIERSMEIFIGNFLKAERDERKLIYAGTLTGDPIKDDNKIIKQYIFANKQRLETFNKMRRQYDAARVLGYSKREIGQIFEDRGQGTLFRLIARNKFKPLGITEGMEQAYERISDKYGIKNPLSRRIKRKLQKIEKKLQRQKLNKDFRVEEERYLISEAPMMNAPDIMGAQNKGQPLAKTPMPIVNNAAMAMAKNPQTNLTRTEEALLSPSEKIIAGRT